LGILDRREKVMDEGSAYDTLATSPGGLAGDVQIDWQGVLLLLIIIVFVRGGLR
jgi:hypothetical protein